MAFSLAFTGFSRIGRTQSLLSFYFKLSLTKSGRGKLQRVSGTMRSTTNLSGGNVPSPSFISVPPASVAGRASWQEGYGGGTEIRIDMPGAVPSLSPRSLCSP